MSSPFESYDDLEDADERLQAADPAERRVAIIALGHSGDPAAVAHLAARDIAATALAIDLAKPDTPASAVETALTRHGRLDILVNNAGTNWGAPAEDHPLAAWDKTVRSSIPSAIDCCDYDRDGDDSSSSSTAM